MVLTNSEHGILKITANLILDGLFYILVCQLGIFLEGGSQLGIASRQKNLLECGLISAPGLLTSGK